MTKKRLTAWLTVAYIALLTTLCLVKVSVPMPQTEIIGFDKLIHFGIYVVLNTLLIANVIAHRSKATSKQIIATTLAAIAYGVAIEVIQQTVGRDFDLYDIVANSLGAITAALLLNLPKIQNILNRYS